MSKRIAHTAVSALIAALATAAPAGAGQVLRLGAGVQSLHATPQEAIDVASDGDVLLFEAGTYPGFTVGGLALTLAALPGAAVQVQGAVEVRGLSTGERVILSGLVVTGPADLAATTPTHALWIRNCAGPVVVQDCTLQGNGCGSTYRGGYGLRVTGSARVALLDCTLRGGGQGGCGTYQMFDGGVGVSASSSNLLVQGSTVFGGGGEDSDGTFSLAGGDGATAVHLNASLLHAAGSSFHGGAGGDADGIFNPAGDGGDGLYVDSTSTAHLLDVTATGGPQGYGLPAYSGQPIVNLGTLVQHAGSARALAAPRQADEADAPGVTIEGEGGDRVWPTTSLGSGWVPWPTLAGVWLVQFPARMRLAPWLVVPPAGTAVATLPPQPVDSPVGATGQVVQLYVQGASSGAWLGGARAILRFDRQAQPDCDGNGVFDVLDLLDGTGDCNGDWQLDACQIASGQLPDCNANGVPDGCDIAAGTSVDLNGNGIPDECEGQTVWHVDAGAPPGGDGSATSPFQALGEAFAAAISGDEILVAPGSYTGAANRELDFNGRTLLVHGPAGAAATIVDAQASGRVFLLSGGEGAGTRIEGFTLRNGRGPGSSPLLGGGAICALQASFEVRDCVFEGCASGAPGDFVHGGGLNADECVLLVDGCSFLGNSAAGGFGGGVSLRDCLDSVVRGSTFEDNGGARRGGGLHSWDSELVIARCTFLANTAEVATVGEGGGAAYVLNFARTTAIMDCLLAGNTTVASGGALNLSTFATPIVVADCTFTANSASGEGGALAAFDVQLANSILWGDSAGSGNELQTYSGPFNQGTLWVASCLVAGGQAGVAYLNNGLLQWGAGNQTGDPLFVDPDGADNDPLTFGDNVYRLSYGSPALDAGDNAAVPPDLADLDGDGDTGEPLPLDLVLKPRFTDLPSAPDVGFGTPPLVDLGCYERQQ